MSRKQKLYLNISISLLFQIVNILCAFVLPRAILSHFGSTVNGLVNSIQQFLTIFSLLDCGISAVIGANLYAPLSRNDVIETSKIFCSSRAFYKKIAYIFLAYIFVMMLVYPRIVSGKFGFLFVAALIGVLAINSLGQYLFGINYLILLNSDQRSGIVYAIKCITLILSTVTSVILINSDFSIVAIKLASALIFLLQPILMKQYVDRHYSLDYKISYSGEPVKQKWNGLAQHIAFYVTNNTDTLVLTLFSNLENVSVYSVYYMVLGTLRGLFSELTVGVSPLIGNMLARGEKEKLTTFFDLYEFVFHFMVSFIFTMAAILIVPFVSIYAKGINDADYYVPMFAILLTAANGVYILRTPYNSVILSGCYFKQTQWSYFIEAMINLIISVATVRRYGLVGVAVGTLLAASYMTCYQVWYLSSNILCRPIKLFLHNFAVDVLSVVVLMWSSKYLMKDVQTYLEWFILAMKLGVIGLFEYTIIRFVLFKELSIGLFKIMTNKFKFNM